MDQDQSLEKDHEHRKNTGVGMFLNQAASSSSSSHTWRVQNYEKTISVKDYDQPFYCKTCHIECNSDAALESHLNGKNHLKKLRQLGLEEQGLAPKQSAKLKHVPKFVFLVHKISAEPNEPILGLQYVEEFITETDQSENEPRYTCNLCCVTGEIEPFWTHIIGSKHRYVL